MPTKPPNPQDIKELAVRPMVIGDIQQGLRFKRRQHKAWQSLSLFDGPSRIAKNDPPMIQIAKKLAAGCLTAEPDDKLKWIAELSKLSQAIEKDFAAHYKQLIQVTLEAAKLELRENGKGGDALGSLANSTREELIAALMEEDGMSREEAESLADAAIIGEVESGE